MTKKRSSSYGTDRSSSSSSVVVQRGKLGLAVDLELFYISSHSTTVLVVPSSSTASLHGDTGLVLGQTATAPQTVFLGVRHAFKISTQLLVESSLLRIYILLNVDGTGRIVGLSLVVVVVPVCLFACLVVNYKSSTNTPTPPYHTTTTPTSQH